MPSSTRTKLLVPGLVLCMLLAGCFLGPNHSPMDTSESLTDARVELGGLSVFITDSPRITANDQTYRIDELTLISNTTELSYTYTGQRNLVFNLPAGPNPGLRHQMGTYTLTLTNTTAHINNQFNITLTNRGPLMEPDVTITPVPN